MAGCGRLDSDKGNNVFIFKRCLRRNNFQQFTARLPFVQLSEWVEVKRMVKPHKHFILKSDKKKLPMAKPRSRCIWYVAADAVAATSTSKAAASATTAAQWPGAMATSATEGGNREATTRTTPFSGCSSFYFTSCGQEDVL